MRILLDSEFEPNYRKNKEYDYGVWWTVPYFEQYGTARLSYIEGAGILYLKIAGMIIVLRDDIKDREEAKVLLSGYQDWIFKGLDGFFWLCKVTGNKPLEAYEMLREARRMLKQ